MDISKINPYIRVAQPSVISAGEEIKRRIIFDYELIYIERGALTFTYNDVAYRCAEGDFLLIRPGVPHSFGGILEDLSQPHIHFDITHREDSGDVPISYKDMSQLTDTEKTYLRKDVFRDFPKNPFVTFRDTPGALGLFYEIVAPGLSLLARKGKLMQLLDRLIADNFPALFDKNDTAYSVESAVKDYLDAGQGMTSALEDIAKQFNYSKYYLERRFKDAYGISLMAYRNEVRLLRAKELLQEMSVSAVAEQTGFSSIYTFSRAFQRHFGMPPSHIKKHSKTRGD